MGTVVVVVFRSPIGPQVTDSVICANFIELSIVFDVLFLH